MKRIVFILSTSISVLHLCAQNTFPSNGNVGIGTVSPLTPLDIKTSSGSLRVDALGTSSAKISSTAALGLETTSSSFIQFLSTGSEIGRFTGDGKLGIGTSTPSSKLHVSSSTSGDAIFKLEADTDNSYESDNTWIHLSQDGGSLGAYIGFNADWGSSSTTPGAQADNLFRIGTRYSGADNYNRLVINTNNGNVGIGTSSPLEKLDVNGKIQSDFLRVNAVSSAEGGEIMLDGPSGHNDWRIDNRNGAYRLHHSGTTFFQLAKNGNTGIGTTSPTSKLHVSSSTSGDAIFKLEADTDNNNESDNAWIQLTQDGGSLGVYMGFNADWGSSTSIPGAQTDNLFRIGTRYSGADSYNRLVINTHNGNVGIATTNPDSKLTVKGSIHAEEVKVDLSVPGPDYVFEPDYHLKSLEEIEKFIQANKHLPEIPSAKEMEANGVQLGEMNMLLLKKIEELTLYLIDQQKTNAELLDRIKKLENQ